MPEQRLKAVIFDFDGVICESVDAKVDAFRRIFADHPEHLSRILEYHIKNGGISRYEKFKVIYRDILKKELTAPESKRLGEKFAEYCYQMVVDAPLVKVAGDFLEQYHRKLMLFVASGTPDDEMKSIVKAKKLQKFFKKIYGSPQSKFEIVRDIMNGHGLPQDAVVFLGDSINDYEGARQAGIQFIGRVREGDKNPFSDVRVEHVVKDVAEFLQWLKTARLL